MSIFGVNNPGIIFGVQLTDEEVLLVQELDAINWQNGDILYYNSGFQRLAKGTDGEVLKLVAGIPSWESAGSGSVNWGDIGGTLASQTDLQTALDAKVDENAAITGATKTKITYDAKGLVTAGADATTADIADSSNKRYVTDAQLVVIGNTSGTNTGDQNLSGLVPYTGATGDVDLGVHGLTLNDLNISAQTASRIAIFDASKNVISADTATYPTLVEFAYVKGVTSAIQTQLNAKAPINNAAFTGTFTLPTGLTGVLRADSGVVSTDSDVTDLVSAATTSAAGKVELAIASEVTTGTDPDRAVTPNALADSTIFGRKSLSVYVVAAATDVSAADGQYYFMIPEALNGMNLVRAIARVVTAGTTNATTIDIFNVTDSVDMLSTAISIASGGTLATAGTVNTSTDDVATNDLIRIDVTSVSTTKPKGLIVEMEFQLP